MPFGAYPVTAADARLRPRSRSQEGEPALAAVRVRVPATSANLGPGFDSLGLALTLSAEVVLDTAGPAPRRGSIESLVVAAALAAFRRAEREPPDSLSACWLGDLPVARGLGASAAARAAGLLAANALMDRQASPDELLELGADLEGHADNMAPALFGGLQVVVREDGRWLHLEAPLPAGMRVVLFVPDFEMPTNESRKALPATLSREDAVHNASRTALLIAALARDRLDLLDTATRDRLHQPARARIFPALPAIMAAAKSAGAACAYLSGGGSTVAAWTRSNEDAIARAMASAASAQGYTGRSLLAEPSAEGARVTGME